MADEFVGHDPSWGDADQVQHTEYKTTVTGTIPRMQPIVEDDPGIPDSPPPLVADEPRVRVVEPPKNAEFIGAPKEAPRESVRDVLDQLAPRYDANSVTIVDTKTRDGKPVSRTYVQRPLSFVAKYELYAVVGDAIDRATEDVGIDGLLESIGLSVSSNKGVSGTDLRDATQIMRIAAKLLRYSPTLIHDLFAVLLDIPMDERAWAAEVMRRSPEEGGIDDDEGFAILETAIDQNAEAIEAFFVKKGAALVARAKLRLTRNKAGRQ
jgi:hypothetical protein